MTATEIISVRDEGRALVAQLVDDDPREQQAIADAAGIHPSTLSLLKSGGRSLNLNMARRLARAWPDASGELTEVAGAIADAGRLPEDFPGLLNLLRYHLDRTPSPAVAV